MLVLVVVAFVQMEGGLFWSTPTLREALYQIAVPGLVCLGVIPAFAGGMFDMQFGYLAGLGLVEMAWLVVNQHVNASLAVVVVVVTCAVIGAAGGYVGRGGGPKSLIATLGIGSGAFGLTYGLTGTNTVQAQLQGWTGWIGQASVGPVPVAAILLGCGSVLTYVWLEHSRAGARVLLLGENREAARLIGVRVGRVEICLLAYSGLIAGIAGIVWLGQIGAATATDGVALLFPVLAAVLFGSTQFSGRPNIAGAVLAVVLLQVVDVGFQIRGGVNSSWPQNLVGGVLLLVAIVLRAVSRKGRAS